MVSTTRAALRDSLRFDAHLVSPVVGLVTALPVVALFAVAMVAFSPRDAIPLAVGADLVAIVSLVGAPRLSIPLAVTDALAMGVAVVVGVASTSTTWLHVTLLVPICFAAGIVTVFGFTQGVIGTQAIIAFVVFGRFTGSFASAVHLGLLVAGGALLEVVALILLRLPPSLRFQRYQLAGACEAVAELARSSPRRSATEVLGTVDDAERALASVSLFGRDDSSILRAILNQLRRSRLELTTTAGLRVRLRAYDVEGLRASLDEACGAVAETLDELATALRQRARSAWRDAAAAFSSDLASLEDSTAVGDGDAAILARQCVGHLRAIDGQLRAMGNLVASLGESDTSHAWRHRLPAFSRLAPDERTDWSLMRGSLHADSPSLRHAVRLAVAVPASVLLAAWWALPRGYWVPFAVAVVLKPDYSTLLRRGVGRVLGTAVGATLAAVLVTVLHPDTGVYVVLVGVIAWAAYATWSASFPVAIGLVTALVLVLLSVAQSNPVSTALDRLIDVALGGALAVVAYLVWPTSPRAGVSEAMADLFGALREYLDAVAAAVAGDRVDPSRAVERSRAARRAWAHAEDAVGRSVEEPSSTRVNPDEGRNLLTASMRVLRATHALRIDAERGATAPASEELSDLVGRCDHALDTLAQHFAEGATPRWEGLRPAYRAAAERLGRDGSPATIALHFDELVNALNTAEHVIAENAPRS